MKNTLHQSIIDCLSANNKLAIERLFDRMHQAVEQIRAQGERPVNYCYLVDQAKRVKE